jgi:hypothetical protein
MQKTRILLQQSVPVCDRTQPYVRRSFLCEACYLRPVKSAGSVPTIRQQAHTGYRDRCRHVVSKSRFAASEDS